MICFLKGIFHDLSFSISKMLSDLENRKKDHSLHSDIPDFFYQKTIQQLIRLKIEIKTLIDSGDLEIASISSNNLIKYNTIFEKFQSIELFRYHVIIKYGPAEQYFNKKIKRIYDEIKNNQIPPLVTTISNSENYYWAHPYFAIIAVPLGEENNLLNLPDLYHEISHYIFGHYEKFLIEKFVIKIQKYCEEEIDQVIDQHRAKRYIVFYQNLLQKWLNGWIEEFTCDLIATYLVGPAYAWTNLKLSTISSSNDKIYIDSQSHPSDEARMRAIIHMLTITGQGSSVIEIKECWGNFLSAASNPIPPDYNYIYPDSLLCDLAEIILKGCQSIGLSGYESQLIEFNTPISKILNKAWRILLEHPEEYNDWEHKAISEIRSELK